MNGKRERERERVIDRREPLAGKASFLVCYYYRFCFYICFLLFQNLYRLQLTFSLRQAKGETDLLLSNTHVNVVSR